MTRAVQSELLQALATLAGIPTDEMGPKVCKRLNKVLVLIRESSPEVTIEEMRRRYQLHRKFWPTIRVTPESLGKHWCELSGIPTMPGHTAQAAPEDWRETLNRILPGNTYTGSFHTLAESVKAKILSA